MNEADTTPANWASKASALRIDARPSIGGSRVEPVAQKTFASLNPANGRLVAQVPDCGAADVDIAVRTARATYERGDWSEMSPRDRAKALHAFAETISAHADELALLDSLEMGVPIANALADVRGAAEHVHATAELADKLTGDVVPNDPSALVLNVREPFGVIGAITPWNFPAYIGISKTVPAMAAGNSVVLKPSEIASLSCLRLGDLAAEAGIPAGVLNVVPGLGSDAGAALALHMDVDLLTFTGSTATGRRLLELSGQSNMKRLVLECGGKSPQIVFGDVADIDGLADAVVGGITYNTGQVCVAGSRLLVHRSVHDELVQRIVAKAGAMRGGDPLDEATSMGPLASAAQLGRVRSYFGLGREQGARLALDGSTPENQPGCYWLPTVFTNVQPQMRIAQEEIFGPVLATLAFDTDEEAVTMANGTIYGLTANVWTRDLSRALQLARRLKAGAVTINAKPAGGRVDATVGAFEPHGQSGIGVEGGLGGLRSFTKLKLVTFAG